MTFATTVGWLALATLILPFSSVGRVALAFGAILITAFYFYLPSGPGQYEGRYLYTLIPFLMYGAVKAATSPHRTVRGAAIAVVLVSIGHSLWKLPDRWNLHLYQNRFTTSQLGGVAEWCNHNLPPTSTLLIHDAGYISFATSFRLWDLVGLKSPALATFNREITLPTCGLGRVDAVNRMALAVHPDYFVLKPYWDNIYLFTKVLPSLGWKLERVFTGFNPDDPPQTFDVYKLTPPVLGKTSAR